MTYFANKVVEKIINKVHFFASLFNSQFFVPSDISIKKMKKWQCFLFLNKENYKWTIHSSLSNHNQALLFIIKLFWSNYYKNMDNCYLYHLHFKCVIEKRINLKTDPNSFLCNFCYHSWLTIKMIKGKLNVFVARLYKQ